jgi:hypothetical protein
MASFIILSREGNPVPDADAVIVADRFSFPAFVITIPWLLWHRVWFAAAPVVALTIVSAWLASDPRLAFAGSLLSLVVQAYAGFEGNAWRVEAMIQRGFRIVDIVEASDAETAFEIHAVKAESSVNRAFAPPPLPSFGARLPAGPVAAGPISAVGLAGLGREA